MRISLAALLRRRAFDPASVSPANLNTPEPAGLRLLRRMGRASTIDRDLIDDVCQTDDLNTQIALRRSVREPTDW